ncbi:hypothetical protein RYX36_005304 [Vicia faba]
MQLEGLLDPNISSTVSHSDGAVTNAHDIMGLYSGTTSSEQWGGGGYISASGDHLNLLFELSNAAVVRGTTVEVVVSLLSQSVKGVSYMPINFVDSVWNNLETVLISILNCHSSNYYQLQVSIRRVVKLLIEKKKKSSIQHVQMEKLTDYTCNPEYSHHEVFLKEVLNVNREGNTVKLEDVGEINVVYLMKYPDMLTLAQAYDLKARLTVYWKIVLRSLIDVIAMHLMLSVNELISKNLQKEVRHKLLV